MMKTTDLLSPRSFRRVSPALVVTCLFAGAIFAAPSAWASLGFGTPAPFDPELVLPIGEQEDVDAAGPDSLSLFVWRDTRGGETESRIFGARVRPDGTVLDKNGIEISSGPFNHTEPAVAWDGSQWLVVWSQVVDSFADVEVRAARVKLDGSVLDVPAIEVTNDAAKLERNPDVAWNGSKFIVVWDQSTGLAPATSVIAGISIDSDGTVNGPVTPVGGLPGAFRPAIAALGANALVAWEHADSILAARVTTSGGPNPIAALDGSPIVLSSSALLRESDAAVAASATNNEWLVGWSGVLGANGSVDVYARRVAANGTLPGPARIDIETGPGTEGGIALVAHDTAWLASYTTVGSAVLLRSVPANGSSVGSPLTVATSSALGRSGFGGDPDSPIVAWSEQAVAEPGNDLFGRRVVETPQLALEDTFPIATQTPNQTQPALAFSGSRRLVAWVDDRFGPTLGQIRVGFTDSASLAPPTALPIAFAARRDGLDQAQPAAAFDGTNFSLLWSEERGGFRRIVGARFTAGGAPIDTFEVSAGGSFNETEPALALTNPALGELIVVWTDDRAGFNDRDIWQATIKNGAVIEAEGVVVQQAGVHDEHPSIAPRVVDDEAYLVFQRTLGPNQSEIRRVFLDREPSLNFAGILNSQPDRRFEDPKVAFNGEDYVVTYQEIVDNDGPLLHVPFAQYVSTFYGVFPPQIMTPGSYSPARPVVGSAGYTFVTLFGELNGGKTDVFVRALNPGNSLLGEGPLAVTNDLPPDVSGAAAHGLNDRVGMAFLRAQSDAEWSGTRLFGVEAQDTLAGRVVINEFLANPPSGRSEFYELFNVSGQTFRLNGWKLVINGVPGQIIECFSDRVLPGGDRTQGSLCGDFPDATFHPDSTFSDFTIGPEGYLPNRSGKLQLYSPQNVLVDQVAYGDSGGAPVVAGIPSGDAPRRPADNPEDPHVFAAGDSIPVSTSRIPNGEDTDNDAADFNLTTNTTPGDPNVGTAAAPGTKLFFTRVYAKGPPGLDAVELFNPSSSQTFDFTNWYLSDGEALERIGVPNTAFGRMTPGQKTVLRQGEPGSFRFGLDYDDVLYLYDDQLARVEQIAWWRDDLAFPDACQTRVPETGGLHTGFSWLTSGGQQDLNSGEVRYTACGINAPQVGVEPGVFALSFAGAMPNPARIAQGAVLAFTVPGAPGPSSALPVRIRVYDVAGRLVATPLDAFREAGEHRVPLAGAIRAAGVYYAELDVAGVKARKSVVVLP
jgi:hypothetical protein